MAVHQSQEFVGREPRLHLTRPLDVVQMCAYRPSGCYVLLFLVLADLSIADYNIKSGIASVSACAAFVIYRSICRRVVTFLVRHALQQYIRQKCIQHILHYCIRHRFVSPLISRLERCSSFTLFQLPVSGVMVRGRRAPPAESEPQAHFKVFDAEVVKRMVEITHASDIVNIYDPETGFGEFCMDDFDSQTWFMAPTEARDLLCGYDNWQNYLSGGGQTMLIVGPNRAALDKMIDVMRKLPESKKDLTVFVLIDINRIPCRDTALPRLVTHPLLNSQKHNGMTKSVSIFAQAAWVRTYPPDGEPRNASKKLLLFEVTPKTPTEPIAWRFEQLRHKGLEWELQSTPIILDVDVTVADGLAVREALKDLNLSEFVDERSVAARDDVVRRTYTIYTKTQDEADLTTMANEIHDTTGQCLVAPQNTYDCIESVKVWGPDNGVVMQFAERLSFWTLPLGTGQIIVAGRTECPFEEIKALIASFRVEHPDAKLNCARVDEYANRRKPTSCHVLIDGVPLYMQPDELARLLPNMQKMTEKTLIAPSKVIRVLFLQGERTVVSRKVIATFDAVEAASAYRDLPRTDIVLGGRSEIFSFSDGNRALNQFTELLSAGEVGSFIIIVIKPTIFQVFKGVRFFYTRLQSLTGESQDALRTILTPLLQKDVQSHGFKHPGPFGRSEVLYGDPGIKYGYDLQKDRPRCYDAIPWSEAPQLVKSAREEIEQLLCCKFNSAFVVIYPVGESGVPPHVDGDGDETPHKKGSKVATAVIATDPRNIIFPNLGLKLISYGGELYGFDIDDKVLHSVPPAASVKSMRIIFSFRSLQIMARTTRPPSGLSMRNTKRISDSPLSASSKVTGINTTPQARKHHRGGDGGDQ